MYHLNKKQKRDFILEKVLELNISAYEISKNTTLTESGASRIIKGIAKNPHENSLNSILEFLESKVLRSEIDKPNVVNDPAATYAKSDPNEYQNCLQDLNKYLIEVVKLQNILRENKIDFKNIFEEE